MKPNIRPVVATLCLIILWGGLVAAECTFTGCKNTTTKQATVFNTFKTSWTVSKTAYDGWCERVVLGKVTAEKEAQVDAVWNKYRAAFKFAFNTAMSDWSAVTPVQLTQLQIDLTTLIVTLSK